ncbi:hypothetical protein [Amycolatopsis solani]|uniref:hypothetical protein n=1 Tax=Amycolatopsis solani TaxID=3028615 RepID=UPI0025AF5CD6|nr:hypothetical protein [Amycolatopsis sp. MEP2-6]
MTADAHLDLLAEGARELMAQHEDGGGHPVSPAADRTVSFDQLARDHPATPDT